MLVACKCLNIQFATDRSDRVAEKSPARDNLSDDREKSPSPATGSQRDVPFFEAAENGSVKDISTVHPNLLRVRFCERVSDSITRQWKIIQCTSCDTDVYSRIEDSNECLINLKELLQGSSAIESVQFGRHYSHVFKIVLPVQVDDAASEAATPIDQPSIDDIQSSLDATVAKHLEEEEAAVRSRIQAYERSQRDAFREHKMKVAQEQLTMFRMLLKSQKKTDRKVLEELSPSIRRLSSSGRTSSLSGRNDSRRSTLETSKSDVVRTSNGTKDLIRNNENDDMDGDFDNDLLLDGDDDSDTNNGGYSESDDDEAERQQKPESPDAMPELGSSLPIAIPASSSLRMARSLKSADYKLGGHATMVAASMREMRNLDLEILSMSPPR